MSKQKFASVILGAAVYMAAVQPAGAQLLGGLLGGSDQEAPVSSQSLSFRIVPASQTVQPGATVVLDSLASSPAVPSYQWTLNGELIPGATDRQLILRDVQPIDSGTYSVIVSDGVSLLESGPARLVVAAPLLPFADRMASAGRITGRSGIGRGNNENATRELGELLTTLLRPGHSVWLKWIAPEDGYMTMSTAGSGFDTTLTAFKQLELLGISLSSLLNLQLLPNAHDDESGDYHTSMIQFNARRGETYLVRVDGDDGQAGNIVFSWSFSGGESMPNITVPPSSLAVKPGQIASFAIGVQSILPTRMQWFRNGDPVTGANGPRLDVFNVQEDDLGVYFCQIESGGAVFYTPDAELQINTGGAKVLANNKRSQALLSIGSASSGGISALSTSRRIRAMSDISGAAGYSGTQIFRTFPGKDAEEPSHCGLLGGASYWLSYVPSESGIATMNTEGSNFDTILAVYRDDGRGNGYASLVPVSCDNDSGADGKDSKVVFSTMANTQYYIVLDGVNGASGTAYLNYSLNTAPSVSSVSSLSIKEDSAAVSRSFTVTDKETAAGSLYVSFSSSNSQLFPPRSIYLSGAGSGTRSITLKPGANMSGSSVITIYVQDANGAMTTTRFSVTVTAENDAPIAGVDSGVRNASGAVSFYIPNLLRNDFDPDGDAVSFYYFSSRSAAGAQITRSGNYLYYSPPAGFNDSDSFTYSLTDGRGMYSSGKVVVSVSN